jgi:hypothetical protein
MFHCLVWIGKSKRYVLMDKTEENPGENRNDSEHSCNMWLGRTLDGQGLKPTKQQARRRTLCDHEGVEKAKENRCPKEGLRHRDEMLVSRKAPFGRKNQDYDDEPHSEGHGHGVALETDRPD